VSPTPTAGRIRGFLPNALKLYMQRPEIAETLWKLNSNLMRDPSSTLDQGLKRRLGAVAGQSERMQILHVDPQEPENGRRGRLGHGPRRTDGHVARRERAEE
jgi:hypothetical protein